MDIKGAVEVTPQSAKSKGRNLQKVVAKLIKDAYGLSEDDVFWRSMGASGTDIYYSSRGRDLVPFDVECKCQEKLNIWSSIAQAEENTKDARVPLVVFKRNHSKIYACLPLEDLLKLAVKDNNG